MERVDIDTILKEEDKHIHTCSDSTSPLFLKKKICESVEWKGTESLASRL